PYARSGPARGLAARELDAAFHALARDFALEEMPAAARGNGEGDVRAAQPRLREFHGLPAGGGRAVEVLVALAQVQLVLLIAGRRDGELPAAGDLRRHDPEINGGARHAVYFLLLRDIP